MVALLLGPGTAALGQSEASPAVSAVPTGSQVGTDAMEFDFDRPGQDIDDFDLMAADPWLCDQACRANPNCKAWTYVKPNTDQGPRPRCWLKDAIPEAVPDTCCVSAISVSQPSDTGPVES